VRPSARPLVILGYDFADPALLLQWAREGHLPTLESILRRGAWGLTTGPDLTCHHGIWLSLWSGLPLARHGYYYFRRLVPSTYELRRSSPRDVDADPFWCHVAAAGRPVAIIDAPATDPRADVTGLQLARWAVHHAGGPPAAQPSGILEDAARIYGPRRPTPELEDREPSVHRALRDELVERAAHKGELCRALLAGRQFDLTVAVFSEPHTAGHHFWRYLPGADGAGALDLASALRDVCAAVDREMGMLLEALPQETNVLAVAAAGFQSQYPTQELLQDLCVRLGFRTPREGGGRSLRPSSIARRVVPEQARVRLSRRLSPETREKLLSNQFARGSDWSRTTAFVVPSFYNGFVRVNVRGREPEGIVDPGDEYEAVLDRLESDLFALRDSRTGEPVVDRTIRAHDLTDGNCVDVLPDLFVLFRPHDRFIERVRHPSTELAQRRPEHVRDTHHSRIGLIAGAGPDVPAAGDVGPVSPLDLAPTSLALLGERRPEALPGRSMLDGRTSSPAER
jgi:predicted AlkP superfamily phosphohydrolase/phosphomutase